MGSRILTFPHSQLLTKTYPKGDDHTSTYDTRACQTLAGQAAKVISHQHEPDDLRLQMNSPGGSPVDYEWTAKAQLDVISRDGPPPLANNAKLRGGLGCLIPEDSTANGAPMAANEEK